MSKMTGCESCGVEPENDCSMECPSRAVEPVRWSNPKDYSAPKIKAVRKPLRRRSKKVERAYVERRALVASLLAARPRCEAQWDSGCRILSVDIHEILPRSQGGRIIGGEADEYLAVCRWCHDKIETNPAEAHERGFRKWSWER